MCLYRVRYCVDLQKFHENHLMKLLYERNQESWYLHSCSYKAHTVVQTTSYEHRRTNTAVRTPSYEHRRTNTFVRTPPYEHRRKNTVVLTPSYKRRRTNTVVRTPLGLVRCVRQRKRILSTYTRYKQTARLAACSSS